MTSTEYREHLDKPARPIFPPSDDGLCHSSIRVTFEAYDPYRKRTIIVSECRLCGRCFANQFPNGGTQQ